jgi:metallo-beta-lactamase family protein
MAVSICAFGAAEEVTGSKHLLELNGRKVLLECGMFQGKRAEARKRNQVLPFDGAAIDAALLSHGHFDHCGNLPSLIKAGFQGTIHSTSATRDISSLVLLDSAHIQAKDAEYFNNRRQGKKDQERAEVEPLYTEDDVIHTLDHFMSHGYGRPFTALDGLRATFFDAGHILGSALVLIETNGLTLGFTGDLGRPGLPILRNHQSLPPLDYLICESTYGNRRHDPMGQAMDELAEVINSTIKKGGRVVIPAFAVERTQELIYYLHLLHDQKRIPDLPIFVDSPMAVNATAIFRAHPECFDTETRRAFTDHAENPFGFERLTLVTDLAESKRINDLKYPHVVISSSGMCEAGRILYHLARSVPDHRDTILIVGFMAQNTLGRRLADREKEVKIFGETYPLRARVKILNAFSAHADYEETRVWLRLLDGNRLKGIFLVHGEPDAQANLKQVLEKDGFKRVEILHQGEAVTL